MKYILFKYIAFCFFATAANLGAQRFVIWTYDGAFEYVFALFTGTLIGLVAKFNLDKYYIFYYSAYGARDTSDVFLRYSFTGVITTSIFWLVESIFYFFLNSHSAREVGAVIGLSIGYIVKYRLDKEYVFKS